MICPWTESDFIPLQFALIHMQIFVLEIFIDNIFIRIKLMLYIHCIYYERFLRKNIEHFWAR